MIRPSNPLLGTNLNSVWLEGVVVADPVRHTEIGRALVRFPIRDNPQPSEPPSFFEVEAGPEAFDGCREWLGTGHRIRLIGRLKQTGREPCIVAESIEVLAP